MQELHERAGRGVRAAQAGLLTNSVLAMVKLLTGIAGSSYALIADAVESTADVFSSLVVWGGLRLSTRSPDDQFPFGYGKAEPMAGAVVGLLLIAAAVGIALEAVREILVPHHGPAPYTLAVLVAVVIVKEILARRVFRVGQEVESTAVLGDAWHHRSDAITSAVAGVGIALALAGGPEWAVADDWAAVVASGVILFNGVRILWPAILDLMDRTPDEPVLEEIARAAASVPEVAQIETLKVRKAGLGVFVDIHVEADPEMSLRDAHVVSGKVKTAIRGAVPTVRGVLVHMEPNEPQRLS
jgi:cation diffusion facilitator family transporter